MEANFEQRARERGRRISVRVFSSLAEHEAANNEYWNALSPEERVELTWCLSEELWRLRGECNDEPGLCRSLAVLRRR